ncbi:MAG: putative PEP-binding protein, partial [Pseudomonadota bacterium]
VALARDAVISKEEAILRIDPPVLNELLHRRIDPRATRHLFASGIAASPGAATGRLVFSSREAQAMASRDEPSILVRRETSPEDVRGMHAAVGVLTEKGGASSHAAVIARGLGLPCVVGAELKLRRREETLTASDGRVLRAGDIVTLDGSTGQVLVGEVALLEPSLGDGFKTLMHWADEIKDIGVRANADTPEEAKTARAFGASGIGLCRTEHMFFDESRLTVMREMIFADTAEDRDAALARLLPMQRDDFIRIFEIMEGQPVCIRLLDPPLHEFLPTERDAQRDLAEALGKPMSDISRRVAELTEYNPMLGLRGVRLGIYLPAIYDMQARAIFEATVALQNTGTQVAPEVMIPLVSAKREVELVKSRIDAVAASVRTETGTGFSYTLGVMVETPRAALRAHEIAPNASFLSFGTNDLTQMTYGLSRDDAGRFMGSYVRQGVFAEDPFHHMDLEGVGELVKLGAERGRAGNAAVTLSICGEHGGDPAAIGFVRDAGFDYVSCSAFRVPGAKLAAAQLAARIPPKP